ICVSLESTEPVPADHGQSEATDANLRGSEHRRFEWQEATFMVASFDFQPSLRIMNIVDTPPLARIGIDDESGPRR
ncbi:hypothetical protein, partial [Mesorhizobium captivum]|uniref:hypothetical protein n=1 Tax=Mesorhizobium captivum TaxID=3072319 RepID=UPI002A24030C